MELNTFAEVAARYAAVKPMRGQHKDQDVRPIANRRQKWERIVKMDDSTYLLTDGHCGDPVFNWGMSHPSVPKVITREEQINLAPIVWRKLPDGTETVTVRNASGVHGQCNSRYKFLEAYLPAGLIFCMTRQGDHYIARGGQAGRSRYYSRDANNYGNKHYLSFSNTAPKWLHDTYKAYRDAGKPYYKSDWAQLEDDGAALTFQRVGKWLWSFVGGGKPRTVELPRVKKDEKAQYKEKLEAFFNYCLIMRPLMDTSYAQQSKFSDEVRAWMGETGQKWGYWRAIAGQAPAEVIRPMLDSEHPMHLHLALEVMTSVLHTMPEDEKQLREARSAFNNWANRAFHFMTKVTETREV